MFIKVIHSTVSKDISIRIEQKDKYCAYTGEEDVEISSETFFQSALSPSKNVHAFAEETSL